MEVLNKIILKKTVNYSIEDFYDIYDVIVTLEDFESPTKNQFICRFCGSNNPKHFRSISHVVPEFTGNRSVKYYEECDSCNNLFSRYERALSIFGGIKHSLSGVKGKKYPKHIDRENKFRTFSSSTGRHIIQEEESPKGITVENGELIIKSKTLKFKPRYVQKALVKIGLSLMPKEELSKFDKTLQWLANPNDTFTIKKHPMFILIHNFFDQPRTKPVAILVRRKINYNCPEYSLLLFFGFFSFQIFIPFNKNDENLNFDNINLPLNNFVVMGDSKREIGFDHFYMDKLEDTRFIDVFRTKKFK